MEVAVNRCFGGFGLSQKAYDRLIELGIPVVKYEEPKRLPNGKYEGKDDGFVIYDRYLEERNGLNDLMYGLNGRYWENWTHYNRSHPLVIRVIEELGEEASGRFANLKIIEIPDGIEYDIGDYDGMETIHESHRSL